MEQIRVEALEALELKNTALALSKAKELIKLEPENHENYMIYGDCYFNMANYSQTIKQYEQAMELVPLDTRIYIKLGITYAKMNFWEQAISSFRTALGLEPENPTFKGMLGWALWKDDNQNNDDDAFYLMRAAINQGVEFDPLKESLAEFHLEKATATWPRATDGSDLRVATTLQHVLSAEAESEKAKDLLQGTNNPRLNNELAKLTADIKALQERRFAGYPFARKAPIVVGVILFFFGGGGVTILLLIMATLYHFSQKKPGYLANRALVKGDYGDPFWVRRVNEIGVFFNSFSFFSTSLTNVLLWSWAFTFFGKTLQYFMVIFILPFLIASGFYTNYDLLEKVTALTVERGSNS